MKKIGAFEAKTHLSRILNEVEQGATYMITKHGKTIAILSPAVAENRTRSVIQSIRRNRKDVTLGKKLSIKKLIAAGRK